MNKGLLSITALLAAVVLFFAVNVLGTNLLRGARVDLTEGSLYTLSEGSRKIARKLPERITLTLYYSEKAANDVPSMKSYAQRVVEMLREYEQASNGKIVLEIVNPEPFSEAQDRADQAGIAGVPMGAGGQRLYFGLVGLNSTDKQQTIPFFDPSKEGFLEYDLTRLVYLLSDAPKKVVGLMSWLPIEGAPFSPMTGQPGGPPAWQIVEQMKELFDVRSVNTDTREVSANINVLMIVHPKGVSMQTQYAIDQFVLRGGRVLLFVDPLCEADIPPGIDRSQAMSIPKNSDLPLLMSAWGVEMESGKIAGDRTLGLQVGVGPQSRPEPVTFIPYLRLGTSEFESGDPISGGLGTMLMISPGILKQKAGASTTLTPLLTTTTDSMEIEASDLTMRPDPKGLLAKFVPSGRKLILAARVEGKIRTAFPDGVPPAAEQGEGQPPQPDIVAPTATYIAESTDAVTIVVIADCDMLQDRFWLQPQQFGPIDLGFRKVADNGDLVIGALDNLGGTSDLMSLRARGMFSRPFDKVEALRKDAQQRYAAKELELQKQLQETESQINEIQQQRPDGQAAMLLTAEQQAKLEDFQRQRVATRKELRDVQHQLREEIEKLGSDLKVANIVIMPGVVGLVAVGLGALRAGRHRADRIKPLLPGTRASRTGD